MNFLICAATLLAVLTPDQGVDKDAVCATWAKNATIGGSHAMMGHARSIIPLTQSDILELMEHHELLKVDGIPVLLEDYKTPDGKAFLEDSVMYGYDFVKRTPQDQLPESAEQAFEVFLGICREEDRVVSR